MTDKWPAWKVALFTFLFSFIALVVIGLIGGGASADDPRSAGERIGATYGWIVLLAPLVGYIVQKWRLDRAEEHK